MKHSFINSFTRLFVLTVLLGGLSFANTVAASTWHAPSNLSAFTLFNLPTNSASVAVNNDGNGVAVWIDENTGKVMYSLQKADKWTTARTVYVPVVTKNETTESAHVALLPDGTAVAVFASTTPGPLQYCAYGLRIVRCYGPNKSFTKIATLVPGATSWTKANLSAQGITVKDTQIGVDRDGNLTVSWLYKQQAGSPLALQTATKAPAALWSAPLTLYSSANPISLPALAVSKSGFANLVWQELNGGIYQIRSIFSENSLSGAWGAVEDVTNLTTGLWKIRAAIDGTGNTTLVWDENYNIQSASRRCALTCSWTEQTLFMAPTDHTVMAFSPEIAADDQGDLLIAWGQVSAAGNTVEAQLNQLDGQVVLASWPGNPAAQVSMSADGSLGVVGWVDDNDYSVHAANFTQVPGANPIWQAQPDNVLGSALWGSEITLGTASGGRASALWLTNTPREFFYKYVGASYF